MIEEVVALQLKAIRGEYGDSFAARLYAYGFQNPHIAAEAARFSDPGTAEEFDKGKPASVENGQLQVIQFDESIVDANAIEHAEQVFRGGDKDPFRMHEAGRVTHPFNIFPTSRNPRVIQISTYEDNPRSRGGGR